MSKIDFRRALRQFNMHVVLQKKSVLDVDNLEQGIKKIENMHKKVIHTMEVVSDGTKVAEELGFNEDVITFTKLALLDHDIGRFLQMKYTGSYADSDLKKSSFFSVNDHGELGVQVLRSGVLKYQVPTTRVYDNAIMNIVERHVNNISNPKELLILSSKILKDEDVYDIFLKMDNETKQSVITSITQIVQDVDRLDIYHQILDSRWTPTKNNLEISPVVFDMFYRGEYLKMDDLKEKGLWNANVGDLVRLSFINQIRLLSVAKVIQAEGIIMKLKQVRQNPMVKDAFDFTNDKLNEMIKNSEDGITISKVKTL